MGSKFCINCGIELVEGAKFCHECGTPVIGNTAGRKTTYEGEIHKCPSCGEILPSFQLKCPSCGHEIRGAVNSKAIKEFAEKLENARTTEERLSVIRNYPVPNTKEDIFEFLILASSNAENVNEDEISDAWKTKISQVMIKAQLLFEDRGEYERIENIYKQVDDALSRNRKKQTVRKLGSKMSVLIPALPGTVIVFGWLLSLFIMIPLSGIGLDNVGTNSYQWLFMLVLIAGAFFVPLVCGRELLTRLVISLGLVISMVVIIPLCGKNVDNVGTNGYQLMLMVDIVCSVVIFVRMYKRGIWAEPVARGHGSISFIAAMICMAVLFIVYGVGYIRAFVLNSESASASENEYGNDDYDYAYNVETIVWDELNLGEWIPDFGEDEAYVGSDTYERLYLRFYSVDRSKFKSYIEECKDFGFTIDAEDSENNYNAYNEDGYHIQLVYDADESEHILILENPIEENDILWPESQLVESLPVPDTLIGEVYHESSSWYCVYLTGIDLDTYEEYVSLCIKAGFDVDYYRSDTYFSTENKEGTSLRVEYEGFNTICISISNYDL